MIERKIYNRLRDFFLHDRRAVLVTGARQIGKTYAIRQVGQACFEHFVEVNFLDRPELVRLLSSAAGTQDLLLRLSGLFGDHLVPGRTLIFFDEVQECREIVTAIKFLVDEGSYRYVMSGSLLGVELKDLRSVPVGYMSVMDMYPLDLEEFFRAVGVADTVMDHLRTCYEQHLPVDSFIHDKMMELLRLYLLVGGMPAAVQTYLDTNNLKRVNSVQRDVVRLYRQDIAKYDHESKLRINEVYSLIPSELNAQNKRFVLKSLNENARFRQYEETFLWLKEAGVAIPVYNVEEPRPPLLLNKQHNLMKLFLNDVGLLASMYADDIHLQLMQGMVNVNFGAIFENLTAQELYAHGWAGDDKNLFYFSNKRQGELDFLIEESGSVVPLEIKSGKDYHRHNALDRVLHTEEYGIRQARVFCQDNIHMVGKAVYLPIYLLMFVQRPEVPDTLWRIDLTGLERPLE